jgi:HD superfamily phosphodiesterase
MDPAAAPAPVRVFRAWVAEATAGRDASHGLPHFERVRELALRLAEREPSFDASCQANLLLLQLCSLAHDVWDKKCVAPAEAATLKQAALRVLADDCGLPAAAARRVVLVADNVALSKERAGEVPFRQLEAEGCLGLRTLVCDADRLEALGATGLRRLVQHNEALYRRLGREARLALARESMLQHLVYRKDYVVTAEGLRLATELVAEMEAVAASDEALSALVEEELAAAESTATTAA